MPGKLAGVALVTVLPVDVSYFTDVNAVMVAPADELSIDRPKRSLAPMPSRAQLPVTPVKVVVNDDPPFP